LESVDYNIIFRSIELYHGMKGCSDENCSRHVESLNAVIMSLQLDCCTLTNASIMTNSVCTWCK